VTIVESITKNLEGLPNSKLVEVARFVRELVPEAVRRQREALASTHGCLDEEAGKVFEEALAGARRLPKD